MPTAADRHVDLALVGAGGAGLTVLHEMARAAASSGRRWRVAVVDDVDRLTDRPDDRTWCFWDAGANPAEAALTASWRHVAIQPAGRPPGEGRLVLDLGTLRYAMLRAPAYYELVDAAVRGAAGSLDVVRLPAATGVVDGEHGARVVTAAGHVTADWVLDSRPAPPRRPAVTTLLQHFRGAVVRTGTDVFDPDVPVLMDFRTPQSGVGLSFGYCLPLDRRRALVEYTEFSPRPLDEAGYATALNGYLRLVVGSTPIEVEHVEQGAIPMTDAPFPRRAGRRVMRIGTAGGATRPSTGYTFRTMQRQAAAVVGALTAGRPPVPPRPYPRRHAVMDAALLRALAAGHVDGPEFFTRLFQRNPPGRVLTFLDGTSRPASEVALMATAPAGAMLRSAAEVLLLRARLLASRTTSA